LRYIISRKEGGFLPAYDLAFNFLLGQQDVQINASPSVVTVNQTPTKIAIVEEISINTGVYEVPVTNETSLKNAYTRAQYGITIQLTPTIHAKSENPDSLDEPKFITLATDINFDTTAPSDDNRPDVTRRNIKNEVRIADGQTVILGGLRRKISQSDQHSIPFLGELPGIGKFFSTTSLSDSNIEMFIFITPKIVPDPSDEYYQMRKRELLRRPGDIPEFIAEIEDARKRERHILFERSLKMLFAVPDSDTRF
jgi:general secretion pathway protein D